MCLLAVPFLFFILYIDVLSNVVYYTYKANVSALQYRFFFHSIHRCSKHVVYIGIRPMCLLAVRFFFILYIDVLSTYGI